MEKMAQIARFLNQKNSTLPDFDDKFQQVAKNTKGFFFKKKLSYLVYSQIWLNYFPDDWYFNYIAKSLKQTLLATLKNWKKKKEKKGKKKKEKLMLGRAFVQALYLGH